MIIHVFSSWVCDLLDIMKINLSIYYGILKREKSNNNKKRTEALLTELILGY